jgi:hypothetical protein
MLKKSISFPKELAELEKSRQNGHFSGFFLDQLWFWLEFWPVDFGRRIFLRFLQLEQNFFAKPRSGLGQ